MDGIIAIHEVAVRTRAPPGSLLGRPTRVSVAALRSSGKGFSVHLQIHQSCVLSLQTDNGLQYAWCSEEEFFSPPATQPARYSMTIFTYELAIHVACKGSSIRLDIATLLRLSSVVPFSASHFMHVLHGIRA